MSRFPLPRLEEIEPRVTDLVIRLSLLGLFAYLSLTLVRPFLPMLVWAVILAVAIAPLHVWLARSLGGRRRLAAILVTCVMLALVIGPVAALVDSLVDSVQRLVSHFHEEGERHLPPPPGWLSGLPVIGEGLAGIWAQAAENFAGLVTSYRKVLAPIGAGLLGFVSSLGLDIVKFVLSIILAGVLLVPGPQLGQWGRRIVARIVSPRGEEFVDLATVTIRNVSRGVVGVALLQSILIGLVLLVFGVPAPGALAFVILVLCIVQVGPMPVVLPLLIWAWFSMGTGAALLLTLLLLPLTVMDNLLKPLLMGRGLKTPTLVIFLGLLGGTLSYGLIGLFLGPVVLAVFHDLVMNWLRSAEEPALPEAPDVPAEGKDA